MLPLSQQHTILQELFEEYLSNSTSKARLNLSLNELMYQIDDLQHSIDNDLLDITRGSMIDFYDQRFSFWSWLIPHSKVKDKAKKQFLLNLLKLKA